MDGDVRGWTFLADLSCRPTFISHKWEASVLPIIIVPRLPFFLNFNHDLKLSHFLLFSHFNLIPVLTFSDLLSRDGLSLHATVLVRLFIGLSVRLLVRWQLLAFLGKRMKERKKEKNTDRHKKKVIKKKEKKFTYRFC